MTKKTRIRVARIAAGAVIAAGASLTAAGAASALDIGVSAQADEGGLNVGIEAGLGDEDDQSPSEPSSPTPPTGSPSPTPTDPEEPTGQPTEIPEPTQSKPTGEPTEPTEEPSETAPGNGNGGNAADPDGGASTQEQGSSALTDTGEEGPATSAQGNGKELAETGAAEMTFLVIGAATMIAGGIGFRVLPRLMTGRGGAAA
ncbi:hypothetical protein ABZ759_17425 [Streptomyces sp. NPDC047860]|uniref:LPXTG cell wall anchor domain-containing protein n=1 Tax=Streptomyces sp. NPDC047860 TaxID=3155743 RepID=UPI0033D84FE7